MKCWWGILIFGATHAIAQSNSPIPNHFDTVSVDQFHGMDLDESFIRVRLFPIIEPPTGDSYPETQNRNALTLSNEAGFTVISEGGIILGTATEILANFGSERFFRYQSAFDENPTEAPLREIRIEPRDSRFPTLLLWDTDLPQERRIEVRGTITLKKTFFSQSGQNLWSAINTLTFEDYLKSVVPSEVPKDWSSEALKCQAVAARTYAARHWSRARRDGESEFDVEPTTQYQMYKGIRYYKPRIGWSIVESAATTRAVQQTHGKVLTYRGSLIEAAYHANSGGIVCASEECFGTSVNYLIGQRDIPDVLQLPTGSWDNVFSIGELKELLRTLELPQDFAVNETQGLRTLEVGRSRRVSVVGVKLGRDQIFPLTRGQTWAITRLFGNVRGRYFRLSPAFEGAVSQQVFGHGWGHGVGMSQWGAYAQAERGQDFRNILGFYYPGASLQTMSHPDSLLNIFNLVNPTKSLNFQ